MKKYLFAIFVAFFFSGCDDTDGIIKRANQVN
jgi:lipoprotein